MNAVPFKILEVYGGLAACKGLLRDEGDFLCLEFEIVDDLVEMFKSSIKQIRIPMRDLVSVTFKRKWLGNGAFVVIQVKRLELLQEIPKATLGQLKLSILRRDMTAAEQLVSGLHETHQAKL